MVGKGFRVRSKRHSSLYLVKRFQFMISIFDAQQDMREAYYGGAPGVITSGAAWFIAGIVSYVVAGNAGMVALIFGGMLIFPVSIVFCKLIGVSGKHNKENPLAPLAMEGTFWMLLSIPIAVGAARYQLEWFFPAMLFVIGGRYLTFSTLYGNRVYWMLAGALVASGWCLLATEAPAFYGAFAGAAIEFIFGITLFVQEKRGRLNVRVVR